MQKVMINVCCPYLKIGSMNQWANLNHLHHSMLSSTLLTFTTHTWKNGVLQRRRNTLVVYQLWTGSSSVCFRFLKRLINSTTQSLLEVEIMVTFLWSRVSCMLGSRIATRTCSIQQATFTTHRIPWRILVWLACWGAIHKSRPTHLTSTRLFRVFCKEPLATLIGTPKGCITGFERDYRIRFVQGLETEREEKVLVLVYDKLCLCITT